MKARDIAKAFELDETAVSHIRHHRRHTDVIDLAFAMGRLTGEKPINFVHKKIRSLALTAHPELGKRVIGK